MGWKPYCVALEEIIGTYEEISQQRDTPNLYLAKLARLREEAAEARKDISNEIDTFKVGNRGKAKHGELA